jgi:hypothetical protein
MKGIPRVGLAVVALLATAAMAASAQAVSINPDNTAVSGVSSNSSLSYGVAFVSCDNATADGNTGLNSDRISDLALAFDTNCAVAGAGPATVDCVGDITLIANGDDTFTVILNPGFQCDFTTDICVITIAGPQTVQGRAVLDEANDVLHVEVDLQATRIGSALCGPASGTMHINADFDMSPANLTIDP